MQLLAVWITGEEPKGKKEGGRRFGSEVAPLKKEADERSRVASLLPDEGSGFRAWIECQDLYGVKGKVSLEKKLGPEFGEEFGEQRSQGEKVEASSRCRQTRHQRRPAM